MEETTITILQTPTTYLNLLTHNLFSNLARFITPCLSEIQQNEDPHDGSGPMLDHQSYSKPFVILDIIWNMGFVIVSVFVLLGTIQENPSSPLRVWIVGYALLCVLHVGFICFEFRRRNESLLGTNGGGCGQFWSSIMKKLESANTIASSFWWMIGFYWIVAGGQSLLQDSPRLYWLTVVFLALDVFFMIFCVGMACIICLALFCCIPVVAIAYAMSIKEGASEDEIRQLPKYIFRHSYGPKTSASMDLERRYARELDLQFADSECCICLTRYVDGAEMCTLPCNHHFHHECISRWLRINATCPLCKFNIKAKGDALV